MLRVAALAGISGVLAAEVSPVEKVTQLLTELQAKVVVEGKEEAKTYDAFACFCKDTSKAKTEAIAKNNAEKESLNGELAQETEKREKADAKITKKSAKLEELANALDKLVFENTEDKNHYATEIEDIESAVDSLERAIKVLKNSDKDENAGTNAFLEIKDTVKQAVLLADAMGMKPGKALLQATIPDVPVSDYDFHSGGIITTLEDLLKSFRETRTRVNDDETARVQTYTSEKQANHDDTAATTKSLNDAKAAKASARSRIGSIMTDLSLVNANLDDDQAYLLDLTDKCNAKKAQWDQRTAMRMDELTALTQAIAIIKGGVSKHTTEQTIRFMQEEPEQFVQIKNTVKTVSKIMKTKGFMSARSPRDQVLELLRAKSISLKSAVLASLATKAQADPLAKVKKLIEELVLRLQEEAKQEESHNGWCVKQTNLATDKRDRQAETVTTLNTELRGLETKRDKIFETLATLEAELEELQNVLDETRSIHEKETAQRNQAISDAEAGKSAVESATEVLTKFYKERAAKPSLLQKDGPVADNLPDAGFETEYYGDQDTSEGIFGMLEVITNDFVRTIEESKAAQKEADKEFFEFEKETTKSMDEKNILKDDYTNQKVETLDTIRTKNKDLDNGMTALESAITELLELHEACVGGGQTYEERVAKREDEIDALKEAYEILDNYSA